MLAETFDAEIESRMRAGVENAVVLDEPFPHFVVDDLVPDDFYAEMLAEWPDWETFKTAGGAQGTLAENAAGAGFMYLDFPNPAAESRLASINTFRHAFAKSVAPSIAHMICPQATSIAREFIIDRRDHCILAPHVDSLFFDMTVIYFFAPDTALSHLGTILYRQRSEGGPSIATQDHPGNAQWAHPLQVATEEVKTIEFRPNRLLVMANGPRTWHGQHINEPCVRRSYNLFLSSPQNIAAAELHEIKWRASTH